MKWVAIAGVILAGIGALALLVGSRLPPAHTVSDERTLAVAPEIVWKALTDVESFPSWRPDLKSVQRLPDRGGKLMWVEQGRSGKITFVQERVEPPRLLVTRIADRALPFGGAWTYDIVPVEGGSRLRITENGEIYNPIFRLMARYVFGYSATIRSFLSAIEKHVGQLRTSRET